MANPAKPLLDLRFGFLTVVARAGNNGLHSPKARWLCRCDCGREVTRESQYLRAKHRTHPRSCGCHHGNETHKMSHSRPYHIWVSMRRRCMDPSDKDFKNYGARGIYPCARWRDSFECFWADMAEGYAAHLTLGRHNNDTGYSKRNCRWETTKQQGDNKRNTVWLDTSRGRMTLTQAAEAYGVSRTALRQRLAKGWPLLEALTRVPSRASRPGHGRWSTT